MIQEQTRSATIYQFPVGGRSGQRPIRLPHTIDTLPRGVAVVVGDSWYHAEAIREADQANH